LVRKLDWNRKKGPRPALVEVEPRGHKGKKKKGVRSQEGSLGHKKGATKERFQTVAQRGEIGGSHLKSPNKEERETKREERMGRVLGPPILGR